LLGRGAFQRSLGLGTLAALALGLSHPKRSYAADAPAQAAASAPGRLWWDDAEDVPLPGWAKSLTTSQLETPIFASPGGGPGAEQRRGTIAPGAGLPFFSSKRGPHCGSRWLEVGPLAWVCADRTQLLPDLPKAEPAFSLYPDGLPFRYYFVGPGGSNAYGSLTTAGDDTPEKELEPGWAVAIVEVRKRGATSWGRTNGGLWINMQDLGAARPLLFRGAELTGELNVGWVKSDRTNVYAGPRGTSPLASYSRFHQVKILEEVKTGAAGTYLRIESASEADIWVRAGDIVRPTAAKVPAEVATPNERWIDVDLATQTLVAYEGSKPVFATLVSTGRGPKGSDTATRVGAHRIWVKLISSTMDNLEKEDASHYYSMEDVPFVQFFDKAIALHGAFWHRDFGHVRSHGCVNLAPLDAAYLFGFTGPKLPAGWSAVLPAQTNPGTIVSVRAN
jgi:lipoprotein-anchoring transpeptidase ErfK/SrfK